MLEPFRLVKLQGNLWGLALEDEPSFTFQIKPIETYSDEELDLMSSEEFEEYSEVMEYWEGRISTVQHTGIYELIQRSKEPDFDPGRDRDIYQLLLACKAKGYNPEEDGYSLGVWVGEYLTPFTRFRLLRKKDGIVLLEWDIHLNPFTLVKQGDSYKLAYYGDILPDLSHPLLGKVAKAKGSSIEGYLAPIISFIKGTLCNQNHS